MNAKKAMVVISAATLLMAFGGCQGTEQQTQNTGGTSSLPDQKVSLTIGEPGTDVNNGLVPTQAGVTGESDQPGKFVPPTQFPSMSTQERIKAPEMKFPPMTSTQEDNSNREAIEKALSQQKQ